MVGDPRFDSQVVAKFMNTLMVDGKKSVAELIASKRALADAIITADNSLIRDLGREELELLLGVGLDVEDGALLGGAAAEGKEEDQGEAHRVSTKDRRVWRSVSSRASKAFSTGPYVARKNVANSSASRNRMLRCSTPCRRSSAWRKDRISAASGENQSPPSMRKVSGSQLGRLARSSFSMSRSATWLMRRSKPPAT